MERHLLYIINPISGTREKGGVQALIEAKTFAAGLRYSLQPSVYDGNYDHLHEIIRTQGISDIIIAGGDGTVNGVIRTLAALKLPFGILPCGSGNGLALGAGIPKNMSKALDIVFRGNAACTDAFEINGRFACMLCGVGFDAQVAHDFANDPSRGLATYVRKTLSRFLTAKAYPFTIRSGEDLLRVEAMFISIANSNQFGNNFTIAPRASLTDGLLDIVVVGKQSKLNLIMQTLRQVRGFNQLHTARISDSKGSVLYFQTEELVVENGGGAPLHIDGDPAPAAEHLHVRILKDYFSLIYP